MPLYITKVLPNKPWADITTYNDSACLLHVFCMISKQNKMHTPSGLSSCLLHQYMREIMSERCIWVQHPLHTEV